MPNAVGVQEGAYVLLAPLAGGTLNIYASNITQGGTLRARKPYSTLPSTS